jgi:serine phosphatase RsbU (regulator of sigma subunit)
VQFSQEMLQAAVRKHANLNCSDLFDALLTEIQQFAVDHEFGDDVCMVGMEASEHWK